MNIESILRGSTTVLILGGFAALIVEDVLGKPEGKKKRLYIWAIGMAGLILARFGLDQLESLMQTLLFAESGNRGTVGVVYAVIDTFLGFYLPPIAVLICSMYAYDASKSVKIFISTFAGFWACVLHEYPFELMRLPFLGGDRGDGLRVRPELWLNTLLMFLCMAVFYLLYRRFLGAYFRKIIDMTNGELRSFASLPLLCSVVLMTLLSILEGNNIEITSVSRRSMWIFMMTVGVLIFLFVLLYWSLFKGLTLSTQAMAARAELDVAKHIQTTILPVTFPAFPERSEFDIYASMIPAKEIGGDFYDLFLIDEHQLAVCIADVSGKSVPAALYMMTARTLIKTLVLSGETVDQVMTNANNRMCSNNEAGMFVTVWLGIYDINTGKLTFANAGHNPPLLLQDGTWKYLDHKTYKRGIMLGLRENINYKTNEVMLHKGDHLLLYTDGITEATSGEQELYGEKRLMTCVEHEKEAEPKELLMEVLRDVNQFVGNAEQFDDMTMLALKIQ